MNLLNKYTNLIILFLSLSSAAFAQEFENCLRSTNISNKIGLIDRSHLSYRSLFTPSKSVIDGDLIENFLKLNPESFINENSVVQPYQKNTRFTDQKFFDINFDRVDDVWFITRSVYYGSGSVNGKDRGEEIIINILVDNSSREDSLTNSELRELKNTIINKTDKTFNLGYNRYGGGWGFSFLQKVIEKF